MDEHTKAKLRQLLEIEEPHIEDVILICAEYCEAQAKHCQRTPGMLAVGGEWQRAVRHLERAANEVQR